MKVSDLQELEKSPFQVLNKQIIRDRIRKMLYFYSLLVFAMAMIITGRKKTNYNSNFLHLRSSPHSSSLLTEVPGSLMLKVEEEEGKQSKEAGLEESHSL